MARLATQNQTRALFTQAIHLHQAGRLDEAGRSYEKILKKEPAHGPALHHLGIIYLGQGHTAKALPLVRKALKTMGQEPSPHNTLGLIQTSLEQYDQAEKSFTTALALKPDYAEAHFNLARLYFLQEDWANTLASAENLLSLRKDHTMGRLLHLAALANLGQFQDIRPRESAAFKAMPENPFAWFLKGRINFLSGDIKEALIAYDKALALDPTFALARTSKATALIETGDHEAAQECLLHVIDKNPSYVPALRVLTGIHKFTEKDRIYKKLKEADKQKSSYSARQKAELYYSWAKYYKDTGDKDQAFRSWQKAAKEEFSTLDYTTKRTEDRIHTIKTTFPQTLAFKEKDKPPACTPIFITGMPRSGTSLTEQILASHPAVTGGQEMRYLSRALGDLNQYKKAEADPDKTRELLEQAGDKYLSWLQEIDPQAAYITDKMPYNYLYTGFIPLMLPQAKILHIQRHPLDTCLSCFGILFNNGQEWSYDLNIMADYYKLYHDMMKHWKKTIPANSFLTVRYEDLATNTEEKTREILDYCGLPWDPACLEFHKNKRTVRTASIQQVRQPLYTSSIGRWKEYAEELVPLKKDLQSVINDLGYE